ncbi:TraR/DksA C4-type zinc finger protein (plasmid) [Cereibacter azotoformans]|uniref:TraR/DksA C4-type zinc finger protein n=1 Tax=Cereibacter azotoformans TaxID=43057 RepID=UPI001EEA901C|nr:TraR/DksA C4-type zinc finger protein [Cereibacter azotoformans]ULB12460.1 TraR/DksA C4-type zinc finger protein [Cereibacter azotoformans]
MEEVAARYGPRLRAELAELKAASEGASEARRPVELDQQSVGRLSRMDALQGQAMAQAVDARRAARLRALEAALARLDKDEFGWCETCGEHIGVKRLDLDPTLVRCVVCAR